MSAGGKLEISKTRGKLENPHFPIRGKLDIHVRVNNEKNGGVKKAPQARGGRPLRSIKIAPTVGSGSSHSACNFQSKSAAGRFRPSFLRPVQDLCA